MTNLQIITMKAALIILTLTATLAFEFTNKTETTGIIFMAENRARASYDVYTIVYHIDINNYLKITTKTSECIDKLEGLCSWMRPSNCGLIIQTLRTHLDHMKNDEMDINSFKITKRSKRAIDSVGRFLHWAFGVLDIDSAHEYNEKINELQNATERIHSTQNEQLLIIRETLKLNNESHIKIEQQLNATMKRINEINGITNKQLEKLELDERFLELSNVAQLVIMEHNRLFGLILKSLENAVYGKISQLIPIESLKTDIETVAQRLTETQRLPINIYGEDILHVYKFTTTRAALYDNKILLELTIPIIERTKYTIYKTIPVPVKTGENSIIIASNPKHFLLTDDHREYIEIEDDEHNGAKVNGDNELIISPAQNAHFTSDGSCEMSILLKSSEKLIQNNCETHYSRGNILCRNSTQLIILSIYGQNYENLGILQRRTYYNSHNHHKWIH